VPPTQSVDTPAYREAEKIRESGIGFQPASPPGGLPPLGGHWAVQHFITFAGIANLSSRTYRYTFDEAMRDSVTNANAMRHDPIIRKAIDKRTKPVCQLEWQLEPADPSVNSQVENAHLLTKLLSATPRFQQLKRCLLGESFFYGRYGAITKLQYKIIDGVARLVVQDWYPVNGDKIVFKFDGTPGILVNLSNFDGTWQPTDRGAAHFFTPDELETFYWHEFEPVDADFFENELAGGVHGVGFRGKLYFYWWLKTNLESQMLDFLQKIGQGFTIFYYEAGNEESKREVTEAAQTQIGNNVYLFPRNKMGEGPYGASGGPGIQHIPIPMQGTNFYFQMIDYYNSIFTDYILGEALTTSTAATGLGSGVAQAHEATADDRVKYDATDLEYPMQRIVDTLNRWNCPGNPSPKFAFLTEKRNPAEYMESADFAYQMNMDLDEDDIREVLGLPKPPPGHSVLSKLNSLQPTAMNMTPESTPMAGQPGPQQLDEQGQPVQDQPMPDHQQVVQGQPVSPQQGSPVQYKKRRYAKWKGGYLPRRT
jgi:hypothetical protein